MRQIGKPARKTATTLISNAETLYTMYIGLILLYIIFVWMINELLWRVICNFVFVQARNGACDLLGLNFTYSKTWKTGIKSWKSGVSSCSKFRKLYILNFTFAAKTAFGLKWKIFLFIDCKEGRLLKATTKPSHPGIVTTKQYLMKQKGPYKNYTEKMCRDSCKEFVYCSYFSWETNKVCQNLWSASYPKLTF